ncbi:hypothetical protein Nepgr_029640 [Nepenthes gracilis]|uniref:Uncharacterized protein n=1 Tax=Nepenthes gracilis TaxID=150966 RepID=A0AAD3TFR0_NEPGR|nr:hypothetical protein Nepgr_029640 [Nepenthes gracilis]
MEYEACCSGDLGSAVNAHGWCIYFRPRLVIDYYEMLLYELCKEPRCKRPRYLLLAVKSTESRDANDRHIYFWPRSLQRACAKSWDANARDIFLWLRSLQSAEMQKTEIKKALAEVCWSMR